jgi:hypothetical protein
MELREEEGKAGPNGAKEISKGFQSSPAHPLMVRRDHGRLAWAQLKVFAAGELSCSSLLAM